MSRNKGTDEALVAKLLDNGESILWSGYPDRVAYVSGKFGFLVGCIGVVVTFIGLLILIKSLQGELFIKSSGQLSSETTHYVIGGIMSAVGLLFLYTPLGWLREASHVFYVVTDRRIAIAKFNGQTPKLTSSWGAEPLPFNEVKGGKRGSGTLLVAFDYQHKVNDKPTRTGLIGVQDIQRVHALVAKQRYAPGKPASWLDAPVTGAPLASSHAKIQATNTASLPQELRERLEEGEEVLWHGTPIERHFVNQGVPLMLAIGIGWFLMSAYFMSGGLGWTFGSSNTNAIPYDFSVLISFHGLFFLFFSSGPLVGMILMRFRRNKHARHTHYVVTRRRALVYCGSLRSVKHRFKTYGASTVTTIKLVDKGTWGNIKFGSLMGSSSGTSQNNGEMPFDNGFIAIQDPRKVAEIIKAQAWAKDANWK